LAILVLAILNGILREKVLVPALGSAAGLVASGILLSVCILFIAWMGAPWYGLLPSRQWFLIGVFWLLLTLIFEFGFGRIAQHKTWTELFEAYTFKGGNIWPLVLLVTLFAPWLMAKIRGFV
jgi:hypothetical protein